MKKIIILVVIFLFLGLFLSCGKEQDNNDDNGDNNEYFTPNALEGSHKVNTKDDEINPYIVIKGLPDEDGYLNYSVIIFLNFPKNYQGNVLTKRYYNYMQCDYKTGSDSTIYYHNFDHSDDDGGHLSNAFKIASRYLTKEELKEVELLVKYEYELDDIKQDKELLFKEEMLEYDESKFQESLVDNYQFDVVVTKNEEEDYYRYKLVIGLDDENIEGHYDIQTWIKCGDNIIPFVGYYHYNAINGNINSVSDEKVDAENVVSVVYYMVRYYDLLGNVTDTYYLKRLD